MEVGFRVRKRQFFQLLFCQGHRELCARCSALLGLWRALPHVQEPVQPAKLVGECLHVWHRLWTIREPIQHDNGSRCHKAGASTNARFHTSRRSKSGLRTFHSHGRGQRLLRQSAETHLSLRRSWRVCCQACKYDLLGLCFHHCVSPALRVCFRGTAGRRGRIAGSC